MHPGPIDTALGTEAGFDGMGSAVTVVSEGIVGALAEGVFHLFPDDFAKHFEGGYKEYASSIIAL